MNSTFTSSQLKSLHSGIKELLTTLLNLMSLSLPEINNSMNAKHLMKLMQCFNFIKLFFFLDEYLRIN